MDAFDAVGLIGGVAALLGAGAAFWQAGEARKARRDAEAAGTEAAARAAEATSALNRMAAAQEDVAFASRPEAWGVPKPHSGDLWLVRNSSKRPMILERIEARPTQAQQLLEVEGDLPREIRAGELVEFLARARYTLAIRTITIVWRFADEDDAPEHRSTRSLG
ncbi:hypothetical protein [Microbacterium stercoris]|uniref:Uncharacterized protein n=1 Tax=Microbacterium stercoris TaxID=2820289 RepID=A0A939QRA0_9MICO|nr:hypothetical protein [Microbacterium stercoris]MBO3664071.1 hypothetical protein [Microbacterium stercoris]